jgi:nucleotide-binding universal stress UspA family protein
MTTHGRGGLARLWLGSVADDLIRRSQVPILALRPDQASLDFGQPDMFKQILIPLDGSALAEGILEHILALGMLMQAEHILLRIVQPFTLPIGARFPAPTERDAAVTKSRRRAAQAYLSRLARKLRATGARVRTRVRVADRPAPAILAYARRRSVDLIAMSTHGHGGVRRLVLGSVADKVLRSANAPILLYRSRAQGEHNELTEG